MVKIRNYVASRTLKPILGADDELLVRDDTADLDARITYADLEAQILDAGSSTFLTQAAAATTYRPLDEPIYLDASLLQVVTGAGSRADLNDLTPYWSVGDAVIGVAASFRVPAGWSTVNVDVEWFNTTTTAGNALFRADRGVWGDGDTVARTLGGFVACAAPTVANEATVDRLLTGVACTAGKKFSIGVNRIGTDGNDTLSGITIGILGITVTKAS